MDIQYFYQAKLFREQQMDAHPASETVAKKTQPLTKKQQLPVLELCRGIA